MLETQLGGVGSLKKCCYRTSGLSLLVEIHIGANPLLTIREGHDIAHTVHESLTGSRLAISHVAVHV
ncbi:MAG: hypothetical protein EXS25_03495 [Pedosphaera sp.]|nr:hypothetical protein [Pedosphaera sp.]